MWGICADVLFALCDDSSEDTIASVPPIGVASGGDE